MFKSPEEIEASLIITPWNLAIGRSDEIDDDIDGDNHDIYNDNDDDIYEDNDDIESSESAHNSQGTDFRSSTYSSDERLMKN